MKRFVLLKPNTCGIRGMVSAASMQGRKTRAVHQAPGFGSMQQ